MSRGKSGKRNNKKAIARRNKIALHSGHSFQKHIFWGNEWNYQQLILSGKIDKESLNE